MRTGLLAAAIAFTMTAAAEDMFTFVVVGDTQPPSIYGDSWIPNETYFRVIAERTKWMRAERGGFLRFHVRPGDTVEKNQPIATNTSLSGRDQNTIVAPRDGVVLGMTTLPAVSPGDPVAHLAYSSERALAKMEGVIDKLPEDSLLSRLHDDLASNVLVSDLDVDESGTE